MSSRYRIIFARLDQKAFEEGRWKIRYHVDSIKPVCPHDQSFDPVQVTRQETVYAFDIRYRIGMNANRHVQGGVSTPFKAQS